MNGNKRVHRYVVAAWAAFLLCGSSPSLAQTGYGVDPNTVLFSFDVDDTATVTDIGSLGFLPEAIDFRPLTAAQQASTPILYAIDVGATTTQLYTIDLTTGTPTALGVGFPSQDPNGAYDLLNASLGFDFNPRTLQVDNSMRIRVTASNGSNLRLNSDTGAIANIDTRLSYDPNSTSPQVDASAYINNNVVTAAAAGTTALYGLDFGSDSLVLQNPPNNGTLTTVGPFGVTVDAQQGIGFDIYTDIGSSDDTIGGDRAFAVFRRPAPRGTLASYLLYDVDLSTGLTTGGRLVGGGRSFVGGFAVQPAMGTSCSRTDGPMTWSLLTVDLDDPNEATFVWRLTNTGGALARADFRFVPGAPALGQDGDVYDSGIHTYTVDIVGGPNPGIGFTPSDGDPIAANESDSFTIQVPRSSISTSTVLWNQASTATGENARMDIRLTLCTTVPAVGPGAQAVNDGSASSRLLLMLGLLVLGIATTVRRRTLRSSV